MEITATEALRPHNEIHLEHYLISFLFFLFEKIPMSPRFRVTTGQTGRALTLCEWHSQKKKDRTYVHSDYCYRLRCKGEWGAKSMTLVIKGQEVTANSLSGRRAGPRTPLRIFTAPQVIRHDHRDPIVAITTFGKVSYVHEKMPKRNCGWVCVTWRSESKPTERAPKS